MLTRVDVGETARHFARVSAPLLLVFAGGVVGYQIVRAWRWQLLLRVQGLRVRLAWAYRVFMVGVFIGMLTPGRVGEMGRAVFLQQEGSDLGRSVVRIAIDRFIDVLVAFVTATVVLFFRWEALLAVAVLPCHGGARAGRDVRSTGTLPSGSAPLGGPSGAPSGRAAWWLRAGGMLREELARLLGRGALAIVAVAIVGWLLYCAAIFWLAHGIGVPVGYLDAVGLVSVGAVAAFIPISFAGLGTRDAALVAVAGRFGITGEQALAFSGCILLSYAISGVVGWGCVLWTGRPAAKSAALPPGAG